jgi:hypothetical protein
VATCDRQPLGNRLTTSENTSRKPTVRYRLTAATIAVTALVAVATCVLLMGHRSQPPSLSLVFERYNTPLDFNVQDAAYLLLTNSSNIAYILPMAGGTNTFDPGTPLDHFRGSYGSYMVLCEFSDLPDAAPHVSAMSWGKCLVLPPHSYVRLRVPLPPQSQKRKVALLCSEQPSFTPRQFWTKGIGLRIYGILPRSLGRKLLFSQPTVLRVWCDHELSHPDENLPK